MPDAKIIFPVILAAFGFSFNFPSSFVFLSARFVYFPFLVSMEKFDSSPTIIEIKTLREKIKAKYRQYHQSDRDRFPDFQYNTNRANYKPLRASFEEELLTIRGLSSSVNTIHIPSTNTLSLLFTDDSYVPTKKLLYTCWLYVEKPAEQLVNTLPVSVPLTEPTAKFTAKQFVGILALLLCSASIVLAGWHFFTPAARDLIITRPMIRSAVPQELIVEGNVSNAETVWLAVRYAKGSKCWIQPSIKVQHDGWWVGVVYIGAVDKEHAGLPYQLRAFVNPVSELKSGQVRDSWPEAELASNTVEVIRQ